MRRERHNFLLCWLFIWPPPRAAPRCKQLVWPRWTLKIHFLPLASNLNCFFFFFEFQNTQPIASGHDISHNSGPIFYLGFLLWHLWLSHSSSARVNTCTQCVYLTNPALSWKVLSLTKPKGKIYKRKNDKEKKSFRS